MKQLWISDAPEKYDLEKDILLGPWCIEKKGIEYIKKYDLSFCDDPSVSLKDMKLDEEITKIFSDNYLKKFSNNYNKSLGTNYSLKFWRIVAMPWLHSLVQATWLKQKIINKFIKENKNNVIKVILIEKNYDWNFRDNIDFMNNGIRSKNFNHWLVSRLIEPNLPTCWIVDYKNIPKRECMVTNKSLKSKIYDFLILNFPILSVKGMPLVKGFALECVLFFKNIFSTKELYPRKHHQYNNFENNIIWNLDWDELVQVTAPQIFSKKLKSKPLHFRKKYFVQCGSNLHYNEALKIKTAYHFDNGAKLILAQHGGVYGVSAIHSSVECVEYSVADKYISWGWNKLSYINKKVIPLPSPYLTKFRYKRENDKIILVDSAKNFFLKRINSTPQPNQVFDQLKNNTEFIKNLDKKILNDFYFRPALKYIDQKNQKIIDDCRFHYPDIKVIEGDLHDESMKCKVLIVDGFNTTFNIALASNIPVIAFWDPSSNAIDKEALPFFKDLKKHGIIHDNPISAAKKLNLVFESPEIWWNNSDLQNSRLNWVNNFSKADNKWFIKWVRFIWNL